MSDPLAKFVEVSLRLSLLLRQPEPPSDEQLLPVLAAFIDAATALEGHPPDRARVASNESAAARRRGPRAAVAAMSTRLLNLH